MFEAALRNRIDELSRAWRIARLRRPRLVVGLFAALAAGAAVAISAACLFLINLPKGLPDDATLSRMGEMDQATAVFDAADALAFTIYKEQRIEVPLGEISPHLIQAIIATEDRRFYEHHGFDFRRIVSAAWANVRSLRAAQGASTITQQLARQSFLTPDKTFHRKLQELILAGRIEHRYSKQRILELYLNKVYFGDGLYGAEAASRGFFGKRARELTLPESALLAGLVKSPSSYAPTISRERAVARRNVVLQVMLDNGVIDRSHWQAARAASLTLRDGLRARELHGQYFKEQVRRELVERFGWQRVYQGGLRVYSTIDMAMQSAAETAVADSLTAIDGRRSALAQKRLAANKRLPVSDDGVLQAALVALDPVSGGVRAMVGGRDFDASPFNRAVQARRQPGSAFKPFVYAAALEGGYTPATMIDRLDEPIATPQGAWTPEDEHLSAPALSLRTALRTSSNRAAVQLLQRVGIERTVASAKEMGVGDVPGVPSLALGSGEVTLQSMTAAYAAFANHGLVPQPALIRRIEERDGTIIYESHASSHRAISESTAYLMTTMLADVINAGTGARARQMGFTLPAAGKTGTTNAFNDAWFVGYTPRIVAGVWVGFDQPHTILPNGFAADLAVPMWTRFMKAATKDDGPDWPDPPDAITTAQVCRLSGKLATDGCHDVEVISKDGALERQSMVYSEYFARGTEPRSYCDLHPTRGIVTRLARLFWAGTEMPAPVAVVMTGAPPTPPATAGAAPQEEIAGVPETARKRRGFWSKLFHLGKEPAKERKK